MKNILIAGSNGYLGSSFARYLLSLNKFKLTFLSKSTTSVLGLENYYSVDLSRDFEITSLLASTDVIYYFISSTGSQYGVEEPRNFITNNEVSFINLLNTIKALKKKPKIVYISTRLVYKSNKEPVTEEDALEPLSVYAINKYSCEKYLKLYSKLYDLKFLIIRPSLIYGAYDESLRRNGIISFFMSKAIGGQPVTIFGDGLQERSIIHVREFCKMLVACEEKSKDNYIYNHGGGEIISFREVGDAISKKFNVPLKFMEWPEISRKLEVDQVILNSNKLSQLIDYKCKILFNSWLANL